MNALTPTKFKETEIGSIPEGWTDGDLFVKTILKFLVQEKFILKNDLNERTITHKLAEHIKDSFFNYNVDCEYNRMESSNADKEYITKRLGLDIDKTESDSADGTTVFPDIIVHKRGDNDANYLVIEVKKKEYAGKKRDGSKETHREFDERKLCAYTEKLKYELGIYLEFNEDELERICFFRAGKKYE